MEKNRVKISGILFLVYSLIMLISGIFYMTVISEYNMSIFASFFLIVNRIVIPVIMIWISIIAFNVSKNRKLVLLFFVFQIVYHIYMIINGSISSFVLASDIDEYNTHLYNVVLGSVMDNITYILNLIAFIVMIIGIMSTLKRKKVTNMHIVSCVLMAIGLTISIVKIIMYIFTPGVIIVNPEAIFMLVSKVVLIVAVFFLGAGINSESKNNTNLQ